MEDLAAGQVSLVEWLTCSSSFFFLILRKKISKHCKEIFATTVLQEKLMNYFYHVRAEWLWFAVV